MSQGNVCIHGEWSSRTAFILAATGSAVGLGNIWRFPYITGENGGGAFVLVYLLCVFLIGLPVMIAEILLGRQGKRSPINTMRTLAQQYKTSQIWQIIGWSGVLAGFLILSYYSVIAGWALAYIQLMATTLSNIPEHAVAVEVVEQTFSQLTGDPIQLIIWHTLFILGTMMMVVGGVQGSLERAVRTIMPALLLLLLILFGYALSTEAFLEGVAFMFSPDFDKALTSKSLLDALGQAFFTLSLGMGAIMIYGAYLPRHAPIGETTVVIVISDTMVAILAGLIIFPIVFSSGLDASDGPGLAFLTLPIAFIQMPFGIFFGVLFFVLLSLAAWSSAISIIEPVIAWMVEQGIPRLVATIIAGLGSWLIGLLTVFSFNYWSEFYPLAAWSIQLNWFEILEYLTFNIMLPLGGLGIAVFVAWIIPHAARTDELDTNPRSILYNVWLFLLRYMTPIGVLLVFLNSIGVFS